MVRASQERVEAKTNLWVRTAAQLKTNYDSRHLTGFDLGCLGASCVLEKAGRVATHCHGSTAK